MNNIQVFNNSEFGDIRTVEIDGEVWFVGKDVATALGYGIFTHKHSKKIKKIMNIRSWKQNLPITGTSADGGLMNLTDEGSRECNPAYFIVGKGVKMYG